MRRLSALVVVASLLASPAASADAADETLVESGLHLRREHRDAEALEHFRRAYEIHRSPRTRAQIGFAEQALAQWLEAEKDLSAALEAREDTWIASHSDAVQTALAAIRQHIGSLVIEVNVTGAELWLKGERIGALPTAPARLAAGPIEVEVRAEGYEPVRRTVEVPGGGTVTARFEFAAAAAPVLQESEKLGAPERSSDPTSPAWSTRRLFAWGALGATGGFLGAGIAAQVVRQVNASHYNDDARCLYGDQSRDQRCGTYRGRAEAAQTFANVAYVSAGSLAVASAILFLESRSPTKTGNLRPWIDARQSSWQIGCGADF